MRTDSPRSEAVAQESDDSPTLTIPPMPNESLESLLSRSFEVLLKHARHSADSLGVLRADVHSMRNEVRGIGARLDRHTVEESDWQKLFSKQLAENTTLTVAVKEWSERRNWWRGLRDRLAGARGWIIGIATTVGAVAGAWLAIVQLWGHKLPKIGPGPGP